jgi:hypothetical protein
MERSQDLASSATASGASVDQAFEFARKTR